MPRLVGLLGRSWLIGSDDFGLICPGSALLHLVWALTLSSNVANVGAWSQGVPCEFCRFATWVCITAAVWDLCITLYASRGAILEPERRTRMPDLLRIRLCVAVIVVAIAALIFVFALWPTDAPKEPMPSFGWSAWWRPSVRICTIIFVMVWCSQLFLHALAVAFGLLISKDVVACGSSGGVTDRSIRIVLRWFGADDSFTRDMVEILMRLLGDVDLAPSDLMFGLLLVGATQNSIRGTVAGDFNESAMLNRDSLKDQAALRELERFAPYAFGIYGCPIQVLSEAAYEGTSIPDLSKLACVCCKAMPCLQRTPEGLSGHWCCCPPQGTAQGDNLCRTASYALRRSVAKLNPRSQLVGASWISTGLDAAPPFAVFCDHESRELIISIRGSLCLKDCIVDLACKPVPYIPSSAPSQSEHGDGENMSELYVHLGMRTCMRDLKRQLDQLGWLDDLKPGGKANGYNVICTGHSLGAGIAVLLAFELRQSFGDNVRYVGFEPPACLSPGLARKTRELGWSSVVCADDWVPRVSLRSLQKLREDVMDQLFVCPHSKAQLAVKFSAQFVFGKWRWWHILPRCAAFFRATLRRWRFENDMPADVESRGMELAQEVHAPPHAAQKLEERRTLRCDPDFFAEEQHCAGNLVVLKPIANERILCGWWSRDTAWKAEWGSPEQFTEILVMHRAFEYHFPNIVSPALKAASHILDNTANAWSQSDATLTPLESPTPLDMA